MRTPLFLALLLVACSPRLPNAPEPGRSCSGEAPECASASVASVCENGSWVEYSCPARCSGSCDWSKARAGDACPASFEGVGGVACAPSGDAYLGCRGVVFVEVPCPRCARAEWGITCGG